MEITERYRSAVRKNRVFVVIFALVFVFSLFSTLQASASTNLFKIQSVALTDKSTTVNGDISSSDDSKINSDIVFHQVGDYATYTITLKNTDSEEHTIESITDDNTNANIAYTYDSHANEQINADESISLVITVNYVYAEADVNNRIQNSAVNIYIKYIGTDEPDVIPIVPNTGDNLIINAAILVISAAGLIVCLFIAFKKNKKYARIFAVIISLTTVATVFVSVYAETVKTERITVSYKYSLFDKIIVTYKDESGAEHQEVTNYGGTVSLPELTKTGYSFGGWKYEDDSNYSASDTFESDAKLSPIFTPNQYTIAFNANGGNGEMNSLSMTYDEAKNLTANSFTKTGHSFESWNTQADGEGNAYTNSQSVKNLSSVKGATVTLYAQWTANSYTISYDAGEGTGNMESTECTYGQSCALSSNTFTRTGYTFSGWKFNDQNFTDGQNVTNLAESGTVTLVAQWTPISYTIKFDANSGNGSMSDLAMTYDVFKALTTNSFTKAGHSFANWNTQSDGEGDTYANNQTVNNLSSENGATVTLYAQWTANSYTISYDANNGTGTMDDTNCTYGQNCALRTNSFTRAGYTFNGWKLNEQSFTDGQSVTNLAESGTVTLVAQWTANTYTITYASNDGTGDMEDTVCTYDSNCQLRTNSFAKTGHTFNGWLFNDNTYTDGQNVANLAESGTITLVAQWSANTYTISYDANNGSGNMANTTCTYGQSCTLRTNSFTRAGYTFSGWKFNDQNFTDSQSVTNLAESGTITLVAQWTANIYTISYDANTGAGDMEDTVCTYDSNCTLRTSSFTKAGYAFSGWTYDNNTYTDGQNVINLAESGTITLVAQWTANTYTIVYDAYGGSGNMANTTCTYDASCTLRTNTYAKTGHSFSGWTYDNQTFTDGQGVTNLAESGTITLVAQWTANNYTISYNANGGSGEMADTTCTYSQSCTLRTNSYTKTGHTFNGWKLDEESFTDGQNVTNLAESGSVTLVAQWTANNYTIAYLSNDGTGDMEDTVCTYGASCQLRANSFTKTGHTFSGWLFDNQTYNDGQSVTNLATSGTITFIAQWTANDYTIIYDANGGTGDMEDTVCTYGSSCQLRANSYAKAGHTFDGWKLNDQDYTDGQSVTNLAESGSVTLVAKWLANSYTIVYDANNGSGDMANTNCVYGQSCALSSNTFTRTGYTFSGWVYNNQSYTDGQNVTNLAESGTVTLVAQWTPISYTIEFDANGGTGTMSDLAMTYDESKNLTANAYSKTGHTFTNWTTAADGSGNSYTNAQSVSNLTTTNGDTVMLYAQWSANNYTIIYDANGGTGNMTNTTCTYGVACQLTSNAYTKTGHTFSGWAYDNHTYTDGQSVNDLAESGTVTLVAQWTANTYTIVYDANGGSGNMTDTTCTYDSNCTLRTNAYAKTGYTFSGWTYDNQTFTDGQSVTNLATSGTITLVAQWTANTYIISYDANGGSGTMTDTTCTYDSSCALSANAYAKTGYTFNGWLYDNQTYNDGQDVTNLATSGTITFVAQWTPISYTIAFDDNGGSGTMNPINTTYGTQVQLTPNAYVWPGYTFTGWNTAADGTGTDYADNDTVDNLTTVNGDTVTLYAQWRQEQILVCKAATQLHTEVCESSGSCNNVNSGTISGGSIYTVGSDKIITYGMIPSANSPKPGDAYDCDLTGNGVYDERFYALAVNDSRNLDLVYYTNYNNGPDVDSTAYYNDSLEKLPTKAQWSNPNLVEFSQDQISSLIPIEDLRSACSPGTTGITNIDVKRCIFTLENSSFRIDNRTFADGIWLEKINQSHYRIMTTSLAVNARPGNESLNATRPVIRVPLQLIEGVTGRSYTITYDNTGGDPITPDEVTSGDSIDHLPIATGVQNAYFSGWSLTSDGQSPINEYYIITGDVTLYAIWTQTSKTACAKGQYFNTLQEAINLVRDNNERTTVTLLQDTAEVITIAENQNIAFDLQNYTLSNVSASSHLIDNSGTLEISNGTITSSASQGSVNNLSTGTLIISGGTITNTGSKQAVWNDGGNVTITGNPIISNTTSGRATVHNLSDGTMTIEGGAITSNGGIAVYNQKGTLTIGKKDGSINTSSPTITAKTYGIVVYQNYDFNFYDGTISGKTYPNGYTAQDASGPTSITKDETDSKVSDIESGSTITKDTSSTYKTMYLTMAP